MRYQFDSHSPNTRRLASHTHSLLGPRVLHLYVPLCEFLMRQVQADGRKLIRIEFIRDFQYVNPYGADSVYSDLKSVAFYRYDAIKRTGAVIPVAPASGGRQPAGTNVVRKARVEIGVQIGPTSARKSDPPGL